MKVLHASSSINEVLVFNLGKQTKEVYDMNGASLVFKPAFKIGDVSKLLGRKPDTIRKWERKGYIPVQKKWNVGSEKFIRFYSAKDVEEIRDMVSSVHIGRPRKDKRPTNSIPAKGNLKSYLRERMKKFNG